MYSKKQKELLLFGYTRLNYDGDIPDDITLSIVQWVSNVLHAVIEGDMMKEFKLIHEIDSYDPELAVYAFKHKYSVQLSENLALECTLYLKEELYGEI